MQRAFLMVVVGNERLYNKLCASARDHGTQNIINRRDTRLVRPWCACVKQKKTLIDCGVFGMKKREKRKKKSLYVYREFHAFECMNRYDRKKINVSQGIASIELKSAHIHWANWTQHGENLPFHPIGCSTSHRAFHNISNLLRSSQFCCISTIWIEYIFLSLCKLLPISPKKNTHTRAHI